MTDYTEYTRTASDTAIENLQQAKDISLASIEVLKSLTSVLVPLSVSMLPKSQELVPTIDTVVNRSFDTIVKVVESQYKVGTDALHQLGSAVSSI
ncbi:MAG: hypothetical protein M3R48_01050 [Candidatus Dormibacteraeota bacterium]|nr:hypothetical protein [Candidatus Dormibacteraeota bacterium]